jgi:hypothetical protein
MRLSGVSRHLSIRVNYRNYKGEVAIREITPRSIRFGATEHHPEPQWLMEVWDHDKDAERTYAMKDCDFLGGSR